MILTDDSATFGFLASTDSGTLLNRFSQDMSLIGQALPMVLLNFVMSKVVLAADNTEFANMNSLVR
jgi:hypothetical protein